MGIGLCLQCVSEIKAAEPGALNGRIPSFGITLAPMMIPIAGPTGQVVGVQVATVPACWEHISGPDAAERRSPLLVAQGSVPRAAQGS
jgi:hypothetical protein